MIEEVENIQGRTGSRANKEIVQDINKMFPPDNPVHPICFVRVGEVYVIVTAEFYAKLMIKGEEFIGPVADYFGDIPENHPWIHPKLEEYAESIRCFWQWESPGGIVLCSK